MPKGQFRQQPGIPIIDHLKGAPIPEISGGAYISEVYPDGRCRVIIEEVDEEAWQRLSYPATNNITLEAADVLIDTIDRLNSGADPDEDEGNHDY